MRTAVARTGQMAQAGRLARAVVGAALLALMLTAAGCTTVLVRSAVPEKEIDTARPYGIEDPFLRTWGDTVGEDQIAALLRDRIEILSQRFASEIKAHRRISSTSLALSGGGPDGAFGAGLLAGWTERGDRPEFGTVTGVSTGAIIALFAFLGPEYDQQLREIYTTYTTSDLLTPTIFAGLTGGTALTDTSGYRRLIEQYIDDEVVRKIAEGYLNGRLLLIGTTNLDAARPVVWNLGAIAASGHPQARRLIHDVIQASSAIPAAFPPVLVPVTAVNGRRYDEMHVDGGATQQVMLFSPEFPIRRVDRALGITIDRSLYVVINNKLQKPYRPVRPRLLSIAGAAVSSLISGSGTGDVYKLLAVAQRDDIDLNVTWIPRDFDLESDGPFDPVYMQALYDLGFKMGVDGDIWEPFPPGFNPDGAREPQPEAAAAGGS